MILKNFLKKMRSRLLSPVLQTIHYQGIYADRQPQILLSLAYKRMLHDNVPLPGFDEIGFSLLSENDEDGILLYIFSLIGTTNKKLVDIGCSNVNDSNTSNLLINHGWTGLLIDGDENAIRTGRDYYSNCPNTKLFPPISLCAFITAENINQLIGENGFSETIDLLSIDLDGMDYWVWKAIDSITPRVVVAEYQDIIGPDKAFTVPYRPDFKKGDYEVNQIRPDYVGASLPAFVKLARHKGYRLVGCNRYGYNAFFVLSGLGEGCLPEVTAESCLQHPWNVFGMEERFPRVKDMDWQEV